MQTPTPNYGVKRVQKYQCWASPGSGIEAFVRLTVEPPVSIAWRCGVQTLRVVSNPYPPYPPYGMITLSIEGGPDWSKHYHSGGHAYHVIKNGFQITIPSIYATFFARLIREGRAEYLWGPHQSLQWQPWLPLDQSRAEVDARYTYKTTYDVPAFDVAPSTVGAAKRR